MRNNEIKYFFIEYKFTSILKKINITLKNKEKEKNNNF